VHAGEWNRPEKSDVLGNVSRLYFFSHFLNCFLYIEDRTPVTENYKKSPVNAKGNTLQWCMFESPVKQNLQSPEGARRPVANYL